MNAARHVGHVVVDLFTRCNYAHVKRIENRRAAIQHMRELEVEVILDARKVIARTDSRDTIRSAYVRMSQALRKLDILASEEQLLDVPR